MKVIKVTTEVLGTKISTLEQLKQPWPTCGTCAQFGALDDLKWCNAYL